MEKDIVQNYNTFDAGQGNLVWGAAMQLAWNQLRTSFTANKSIKLKTQDQKALNIIDNFNNSSFKRNDISQKSIYVKCGFGQKTLDLINVQVKKKFPKKQLPSIKGPMKQTDIISYAYLFKEITFEVKFERRKQKQFLFNQIPTESFYAQNQKQKQQILCHNYSDPHNFIVQIQGKQQKDSLVLIKSSKNMKIDQVMETVTKKIKLGQAHPLSKNDIFEMPVIILNTQRNYKQLIGLPFLNNELKKYAIAEMLESFNICINESGAKVQNQAVIKLLKMKALKTQERKLIVLNSSFWIVMKEPLKHPYFCMQVNYPFII